MGDSKNSFVLIAQLAFAIGISLGLNAFSYDNKFWLIGIAQYTLYMLIIRASNEAPILLYDIYTKDNESLCLTKKAQDLKTSVLICAMSGGILVYNGQKLITGDFLLLYVANILLKYNEMQEKKENIITYGTGMACSFFEGYLAHVIPSDGHKFVGFQENIECYENAQGVVFPVRKLFIIITKSLYCPPDLKDFNKENRDDLPMLESCQSLKEIEKDIAGVKNRIYKNSAYMIRRPACAAPVFIAAECATPLHTLHQVLRNKNLCDELGSFDVAEVITDFKKMLSFVINTSPQCKGKCEIVCFDDTDPNLNLADVLLDRIREIEPNFEKIKRN